MVPNDWDEPSWVKSVAAGARNPQNWLASAMRCKRGSDLLREDWLRQEDATRRTIAAGALGDLTELVNAPTVVAAAAFLGGTALENLLKGILIARNPDLVQPDAEKPDRMYSWPGSGHDLSELARLARIPLPSRDKQTLAVLTDFIGWAGRYPTGMSASRMRPTDDRPHGRGFISSEHFERLDELFERLVGALTKAAQDWQFCKDDEARETKAARREGLLKELAHLDAIDADGVRLYLAEGVLSEWDPSTVVCVACAAEMTLDDGRPAAICRCGTLHHYRRDWLAGREQPAVDTYPDTT